MKCVHCATRLERSDWFCPNCRRSVRGADPSRPGQLRLLMGIAAVAALLSIETVVRIQLQSGRPAPPAPEASATEPVAVSVREAPAAGAVAQASALIAPAPWSVERGARSVGEPARVPEEHPSAVPGVHTAPAAPMLAKAQSNPDATGAVSVLTVPPVRTYVYLNGGSLLGEAPLRDASIPAGRHTLVFWTPSVGGRSRRTVDVEPGSSVVVVQKIQQKTQFGEKEDARG